MVWQAGRFKAWIMHCLCAHKHVCELLDVEGYARMCLCMHVHKHAMVLLESSAYHGNATERKFSTLYIRKEERMEKQQLTGPEPVTSRSIAGTLAAEPCSHPASKLHILNSVC